MNKILYIMQGAPGSGKSTVGARISWKRKKSIYSTDDYWMEDGEYKFNLAKLGAAHRWNQARVEVALAREDWDVVVDNTNITRSAAKPYFDLAEKYGYEVQVVRIDPGLETCLARNAIRSEDRKIPEDVIRRMYATMENLWL